MTAFGLRLRFAACYIVVTPHDGEDQQFNIEIMDAHGEPVEGQELREGIAYLLHSISKLRAQVWAMPGSPAPTAKATGKLAIG